MYILYILVIKGIKKLLYFSIFYYKYIVYGIKDLLFIFFIIIKYLILDMIFFIIY